MTLRHTWTQPLCDSCWRKREGNREPSRLIIPERLDETCCICGAETDSGIFQRIDPVTVRYPRMEESD